MYLKYVNFNLVFLKILLFIFLNLKQIMISLHPNKFTSAINIHYFFTVKKHIL